MDDTNLFHSHTILDNLVDSHKSLDNLLKLFNEELDKVDKWLKINKLSFNVTKTHCIVFHNKQN